MFRLNNQGVSGRVSDVQTPALLQHKFVFAHVQSMTGARICNVLDARLHFRQTRLFEGLFRLRSIHLIEFLSRPLSKSG